MIRATHWISISTYLAALACAPAPAVLADPPSPAAAAESAADPQVPTEPPADAATSDLQDVDLQDAAADILFEADVRPILAAHCHACHGAEMAAGGLRLDSRQAAARGGDSGQSLLGGTLETNELWQRVSSEDRTYRMPKNALPLASDELDVLRRWVELGANWPEPVADQSHGAWGVWLSSVFDYYHRNRDSYDYAFPYAVTFTAALCLALLVLRSRAAFRRGRPWASGRWGRWCQKVRSSEIVLVLLLVAGVMIFAANRGYQLQLEREYAKLKEHRESIDNPWASTVYGYPPRPVRIDGPKRLAATYYRGNCERNPELFNGGNYLTSIFHVDLCDRREQAIGAGDPLPADGLFLRCVIERAPGTTDLLFSPEGMASVAFLTEHQEASDARLIHEPIRLEIVESMQSWVAFVPLGDPPSDRTWHGVIYVYTGQEVDGRFNGTLHYGIEYDLHVADGKLTDESDLWMDSFGNPAFAPPKPRGRLPYEQWFSLDPLPAIEGENTKDLKLLGVEEHIEKGFISRPAASDSELDQSAPQPTSP